MADNFVSEANNSAGEIFATDQDATSSAHYPLGKIVWGALNTFNVTSTSAPFPVQLFGNGLSTSSPISARIVTSDTALSIRLPGATGDSVALPTRLVQSSAAAAGSSVVSVINDTATPLVIRGLTSSAVAVTGTISLSGNNSVVTSSAAALHVRGLTDSHVAVTGDSTAPLFVRGLGDSTLPVSGTVTATISTASKIQTELLGNASVQNSSSTPLFVRGLTNSGVNVINDTATPLVIRGATDSIIPANVTAVTAGAGIGLNGLSSATGGLLTTTLTLSSLAQTVLASPGRLYGYSVSNPDSAANVWFHIYPEDSADVTLGTSSALINQMAPFGGGREASWPQGVYMSSGMSITASATAPSTVHDAPATAITINVYYTASS